MMLICLSKAIQKCFKLQYLLLCFTCGIFFNRLENVMSKVKREDMMGYVFTLCSPTKSQNKQAVCHMISLLCEFLLKMTMFWCWLWGWLPSSMTSWDPLGHTLSEGGLDGIETESQESWFSKKKGKAVPLLLPVGRLPLLKGKVKNVTGVVHTCAHAHTWSCTGFPRFPSFLRLAFLGSLQLLQKSLEERTYGRQAS